MQPANARGRLGLRELTLAPTEAELEGAVESILRRGHGLGLFGASGATPGPNGQRAWLDECVRDALDPVWPDRRDLERVVESTKLRVGEQPGLGTAPEALPL